MEIIQSVVILHIDCHSRGSGNPDYHTNNWIPACAGMTSHCGQLEQNVN
jgi:hypothetical protein